MPEPRRVMSLKSGVHKGLEEAANELLRRELSGITKHSEKSDVLTPWKEQARKSREVYSKVGVPDGSLRSGIFHRVLNIASPHLNSVEAMRPPKMPRTKESTHPTWDME